MHSPIADTLAAGYVVPSRGLRQTLLGMMFAILVAPDSVLVLLLGVAGSSGNSAVTGSLLTLATIAIGLLGFRRDIVLMPVDYMFFLFLLCILSSLIVDWGTSNSKEYELLALSLAAYPVCRFASRADIMSGRSSFIWFTGTVMLLGATATAVALFQQWNDEHGKPFVFGFDAGATHFLGSLGFLVIALATSGKLTARRTAIVSALIFLPVAIFAASQVRFTFLALTASLCVAAIVSRPEQRRHIIAVTLVIFVAVISGLIARYDQSKLHAAHAIEEPIGQVGSEKPPSCYLRVNPKNSIAIRKALARDALFLIPGAGWLGTGLDSFMRSSCIESTEVHNSILQVAVEFGWMGGLLFLFVVVMAAGCLLPLASHDASARFVACGLIFVVTMSFAHGRISRDAVLFAFLGCAVGVYETARRSDRAAPASPALAGFQLDQQGRSSI